MIDQILELEKGKRIVSLKNLKIGDYEFLRDYQWNGSCILPLSFLLEMAAQNLEKLFPRHKISEIKEACYHSLFNLENSADIYAEFQGALADSDSLLAKGTIYHISQPKKLKDQSKKAIATFEMVLSPKKLFSKPVFYFPFSFKGSQVIHKDSIYPELVDFGPAFNRLESVMDLYSSGVAGKFLPIEQLKFQGRFSQSLGDFFLRDSVFQIASVWNRFYLEKLSAPFRISGVKIYQTLGLSQTYYCFAEPLNTHGKESANRLMIVDENGYLTESYDSVFYVNAKEDSNLKIKERVEKTKKETEAFSDFQKKVLEFIPGFHLIFREMVKEAKGLFLNLLSDREKTIYHQYRIESKKLEFLAGRMLLKKLFSQGMIQSQDNQADFKAIEILRKDSGKPYIQYGGKIVNTPEFSISHKDGAVAAAYAPGKKIGLDIEKMSQKVLGVKSAFLSASEEQVIAKSGSLRNNELLLLTRVWSAKEAIVKYLCSDLMEVFKTVRLIEINEKNSVFIHEKTGEKLTVFYFIYRDLILSIIKN